MTYSLGKVTILLTENCSKFQNQIFLKGVSILSVQKSKYISHEHCTFYIYSANQEWFLFSGKPTIVKTLSQQYVLDERTGFYTTTFETTIPERYIVYCSIALDLRYYDVELVQLQVEKLFFQQLYTKQQEQQLAIGQLMIALNSDLKIKPLLQKIMDYSLEAIPSIDRGFLMLFDNEDQRLHTVASKGTTDAIYSYSPSIGEGIAGYTFQSGKSGIYNLNEAVKIMWNISPKNNIALQGALSGSTSEKITTMAVPIFSDTRKFGILIVHQFTNKMPFQNRDLQLLKSIASQAAVALKNAEAYEQIEHLNEDYEQNNTIHQLFLNLTLQNVDEAIIIEQTKGLLQKSIHYVNLIDRETYPDEFMLNQLKTITEPGIYLIHKSFYIYPVKNEHQIFGYLLFEILKEIEAHEKRIIENASISLALKAIQFQAKSQMSFKERLELFQHILMGQAQFIDPRYEDLHLDVYGQTFCITLKISHFTNWHVVQFIEHLTQYYPSHPFIFTQSDQVVWILQGDETFRQNIVIQLPKVLESWVQFHQQFVAIGVGTIQQNLLKVETSFTESDHALPHQSKSITGITIVRFEEIGINRLFRKHTRGDIQQFITQVLDPLFQKKDYTLLDTLACYIQQNRSISKTADVLHIHQNTLYHRLQRVEQLTNRSLSDPAHFLELTLALHLYSTYEH